MSHFLLAMMQYLNVQAKAQAELDSILGAGPGRLPTFTDRDRLPYGELDAYLIYNEPDTVLSTVQAIVEETFRWSCPVPLGESMEVGSASFVTS